MTSSSALVPKLFLAKDPQIHTLNNLPADPHLKKDMAGTPEEQIITALAVIHNLFITRTPSLICISLQVQDYTRSQPKQGGYLRHFQDVFTSWNKNIAYYFKSGSDLLCNISKPRSIGILSEFEFMWIEIRWYSDILGPDLTSLILSWFDVVWPPIKTSLIRSPGPDRALLGLAWRKVKKRLNSTPYCLSFYSIHSEGGPLLVSYALIMLYLLKNIRSTSS